LMDKREEKKINEKKISLLLFDCLV